MTRQLMLEVWNEFSKIIPKDAPEVQRRHMKIAFYAGAQAIFFKVIASIAPESEPTQVEEIMENLDQELKDFMRHLANGTLI